MAGEDLHVHAIIRKIVCVSLFLFLFCSMVPAMENRRLVRVGFFPFEGYHMISPDGKKSGYGYEYLQKMLLFSNWKYAYVGYEENESWNDMLTMLRNGEIDLLTSATKTPEREVDFAFSENSIGTSSAILTVKAGNTTYFADDYSNWNGIRVGLLQGNSRNDSFDQFAVRNGFWYRPVYFNSQDELTENLASGTIDAIVTSNLRQIKDEWLIAQFDPKPFYVIVKKGNTELLNEVNAALAQVAEIERNLDEELFGKYYSPDNGDQIAFTSEERAFIRECQKDGTVFNALFNPVLQPLSYVGQDGTYHGILVDICSEIFRRTGLTIHVLPVNERKTYLALCDDPGVAVRCDFSYDFVEGENHSFVVTCPYYQDNIAKLKLKRQNGPERNVGVVEKSLVADYLAGQDLSGATVTGFSSIKELADAVKTKKVDAGYLFNTTAQEVLLQDQTNRLTCVTLPKDTIAFSLGVHMNMNHLLVSILEKSLSSISDSNVKAFATPYLADRQKPQSFLGLMYDQPLFAGVLVAVFLLLCFFVFISVFFRQRQKREAKVNEELTKAIKEAKNANKAKSEFLSRLSHDIRTPINIINGMTEFALQDMGDAEKTKEDLGKIKSANTFLLSLVNDVLDISKIDSGKIELRDDDFDLMEFVSNIRNMFIPLCKEKNIDFNIKLAGCDGLAVKVDKTRLNQVALNLLSNAVKYSKPNGNIVFSLFATKDGRGSVALVLSVEDDGIGMSKEFQKKMFEPFAQETDNPERVKTTSGTGLGLSIVKRIVDMMGGKIGVESELGKGTKVTLRFVFPQSEQLARKTDDLSSADRVAPLSGMVLLAEDNVLNKEIAMRILSQFGLTVITAENGRKAVDAFLSSKEGTFQLILMDIQMPVMNGYQAVELIRSSNRSDAKSIPILAMTADAFSDDISKCLAAGMNGHVSKPINPDVLKKTIQAFLYTNI